MCARAGPCGVASSTTSAVAVTRITVRAPAGRVPPDQPVKVAPLAIGAPSEPGRGDLRRALGAVVRVAGADEHRRAAPLVVEALEGAVDHAGALAALVGRPPHQRPAAPPRPPP